MLDLVGIVFSSVMMVYVIFRAVQLDGSRPWFEAAPPEPTPAPGAASTQPGQSATRRGPTRAAWVRPVRSRGTHR
ncbi:MAG TPA: hypothetical protein VND19_24555 [Acetobacteraceae bacterium]|nr:hypothetical protein [Acetobacteraceae bacterium]